MRNILVSSIAALPLLACCSGMSVGVGVGGGSGNVGVGGSATVGVGGDSQRTTGSQLTVVDVQDRRERHRRRNRHADVDGHARRLAYRTGAWAACRPDRTAFTCMKIRTADRP